MYRFGKIGPVHIGDEAERHGAIAVMLQRLIGHDRPQVGAADADIDDIDDSFAGVAFPFAAANAVAEISHPVQHGMNLRYDVLPLNLDGGSSRSTKRDVKDGTVFGEVDFVPPEHRIDAGLEA